MTEKKYEEIGTNYRFFLGWRHASFAGNVIILYGAISLCFSTYEKAPAFAWLVPLLASPIGLLLWIIDVRTRELYHAAIRAGKNLEGQGGGFYTELASVSKVKGTRPFMMLFKKEWTQSGAVDIFFIGSSLILLLIAVVIFFFGIYKSLFVNMPAG